jgi:hypothetical protein
VPWTNVSESGRTTSSSGLVFRAGFGGSEVGFFVAMVKQGAGCSLSDKAPTIALVGWRV